MPGREAAASACCVRLVSPPGRAPWSSTSASSVSSAQCKTAGAEGRAFTKGELAARAETEAGAPRSFNNVWKHS